ncbi:MAG TPA: hypothetical protein P5316_21280 [Phycisphaerae bacterium]|nr:hypothetical protein [Phycisphaerae bacterium]
MDHEERWHEICQPKLKSIEEKLDMILTQLQGNGMPGYGDRIRDLERSRAAAAKLLWALVLAAIAQAAIWIRGLLIGR